MATTNERVSILETKVDDLKEDVQQMRKENREDHGKVIEKLDKLQDLKNYLLGACALAGIIVSYVLTQLDWQTILNNAIK